MCLQGLTTWEMKYVISWKRSICMFGVGGNTPQAPCWGLCLALCMTQVVTVGFYGMLLLGPCNSGCSDKPGPCKGIEEPTFFLWYKSLRLVSSSTLWRWLLIITCKVLCSSKIDQFHVLRTSTPHSLQPLSICHLFSKYLNGSDLPSSILVPGKQNPWTRQSPFGPGAWKQCSGKRSKSNKATSLYDIWVN